ALKVCSAGVQASDEVAERFRREAQAAAALRHPNLCPVYDVGTQDGLSYLTMAYIEGPTLAEWRDQAPRPPRAVAVLVAKLARAMHEAHAARVLHRDLKPANVKIALRGEPVILDFGLARQDSGGDVCLTLHGTIVGTPAYMSPEQIQGE